MSPYLAYNNTEQFLCFSISFYSWHRHRSISISVTRRRGAALRQVRDLSLTPTATHTNTTINPHDSVLRDVAWALLGDDAAI